MRRTASRADRAGSVATSSALRTTTRPATGTDPEPMPPGVIMRTEHHERIRFQGAKGPADWLRQSFSRCSQQHSNLHVGRLSIRRPLHRRGVFVTVDEEKSRFTDRVLQCRNGRQQNGTVRAVHDRELISGYGCAQRCVQLPNHREERPSVEQPRFRITFRARLWHRKVWPRRDVAVARRQGRLEPSRPQRRRCASLPGFASHTVEWHANQSYDHFRPGLLETEAAGPWFPLTFGFPGERRATPTRR